MKESIHQIIVIVSNVFIKSIASKILEVKTEGCNE